MIRPEVPEFIHAVSRLNSWLRSEKFPGSLRRPAKAIYWLKGEAIAWADAHLSCLHSTIKVPVECRDCHGSGRYTDQYGCMHDHCWACSSLGRLNLRFVQTAIHGGPIWHTPWIKFRVRRNRAHPDFELARWAEGWTVNEPGLDLEPWEVARDLNLVETVFTMRPGWQHSSHDWGSFEYNDFHFSLYVGATPRETCSMCGAPAGPGGYGMNRGVISWTDHLCHACELISGEGQRKIQPAIPRALIDNEHILRFMERKAREIEMDPKPKAWRVA